MCHIREREGRKKRDRDGKRERERGREREGKEEREGQKERERDRKKEMFTYIMYVCKFCENLRISNFIGRLLLRFGS